MENLPQTRHLKSLTEIIPDFDTFIFDCDGILWSGSSPILDGIAVLSKLVKAGKKVFFLTNNSAKSREQY